MLSFYEFSEEDQHYRITGRRSLYKATKVLLLNISNLETTGDTLSFAHDSVSELDGWTPYHEEVNLEARLQHAPNPDCDSDSEDKPAEGEDDSHVVEQVIKKRYHPRRQQYEFLVKWREYSASDNT